MNSTSDNITVVRLREFFARFAEERDAYQNVSRVFGGTYVFLGLLSILINGVLVSAILFRRRRHAPVFYTLIVNFGILDCFKGLASVLFALKLLSGDMNSVIRVDQYSGLLLRFCNLSTILNLALVTVHEYVYICYPLRYSSLVTRTRLTVMIVINWIISASITLGNSVLGSMNRSILIDQDCQSESSSISSCIQHVDRSQSADVMYHVGLLLFCFLCLAMTTGCYVVLYRVISRLIAEDVLRQDCVNVQTVDAPQLLKRRKFIMVIGLILVVYLTFLLAYSVLQIIQLMHIRSSKTGMKTLYVKYICYVFVALHGSLQPLCYLRMKEFRVLVKNFICRSRKDHYLNATEQPILSHSVRN